MFKLVFAVAAVALSVAANPGCTSYPQPVFTDASMFNDATMVWASQQGLFVAPPLFLMTLQADGNLNMSQSSFLKQTGAEVGLFIPKLSDAFAYNVTGGCPDNGGGCFLPVNNETAFATLVSLRKQVQAVHAGNVVKVVIGDFDINAYDGGYGAQHWYVGGILPLMAAAGLAVRIVPITIGMHQKSGATSGVQYLQNVASFDSLTPPRIGYYSDWAAAWDEAFTPVILANNRYLRAPNYNLTKLAYMSEELEAAVCNMCSAEGKYAYCANYFAKYGQSASTTTTAVSQSTAATSTPTVTSTTKPTGVFNGASGIVVPVVAVLLLTLAVMAM